MVAAIFFIGNFMNSNEKLKILSKKIIDVYDRKEKGLRKTANQNLAFKIAADDFLKIKNNLSLLYDYGEYKKLLKIAVSRATSAELIQIAEREDMRLIADILLTITEQTK